MLRSGPHNPITSKENGVIRYLRSLSQPKHRRNEKAFLIEGLKMVEEALRDDLGVTKVVVSPSLVHHHGKGILKLAASRGVEILWISEKLLESVSESKTPQPVSAVVKMRDYTESALLGDNQALIVIAHELQDPGNLGTIIRTAEAAGAAGVGVTANTVDLFNAKTIRASMGSILRLPLAHISDLTVFIKKSKGLGFQIMATVPAGETPIFDVDLLKPTVVILGQEGAGLSQDIVSDIDLGVRIPMAATIDSLNVATAAAVVLYEAMRQRVRK
jgi:RNA methyltransferase, TrmH family